MAVTPAQVIEDSINQLNKSGASNVNTTILYQQYNRIRRRYVRAYWWSWNEGHADLSFALDAPTGLYAANIPADCDVKRRPKMWSVLNNRPTDWVPANYQDLFIAYQSDAVPRYYVDRVAGKVWSNCGAITGKCTYQLELDDLAINTSQHANPERFPDGEAVTNGLTGMYWLATKNKANMHQLFFQEYDSLLADDKATESADEPEITDVELPLSSARR